MLTKVREFIETEVPKKFRDWSYHFLPAESTVFSPDRCSLRIANDKVTFLHTRKTAKKIELLLGETYSYTRVKDLGPLLTKLVEEETLKGVRTTLILEPSQYQLLQTEALPVPPAEFQGAIRWKIKDQLPFPLDDAIIDSFSLPRANLPTSMNMIMLVIARASILKLICEQISASGLKMTTIDIPELSMRNLSALCEKDEKSTAFIYLEEESGRFIMTREREFYFSRQLTIGLEAIFAAASASDSQELELLLNDLALDIQRSFDYYQSQWRQPEPTRILIETSRPSTVELATLLSARLGCSVSSFPLEDYFDNQTKLDLKQEGYLIPLLGSVIREWEQSYATGN